MTIRIKRSLFLVVLLVAARAAVGQCYQNPTGETAVGLQNASSYFLTFYVDGVNKGGVPSGDKSIDFVVSAGQHSLMAVAVIGGETSSASRTADVPAGHVCTWTVTDPPPSGGTAAAGEKMKREKITDMAAGSVAQPKPTASTAFKDPLHQLKNITVRGYIRDGVECLVLEPFDGGQKYSVHRDPKLLIGEAYRITGPVFEVSYCMQGYPTLGAMQIKRIPGR